MERSKNLVTSPEGGYDLAPQGTRTQFAALGRGE